MKPVLPRPVLMLVTEAHPDLVEIVTASVRGGVNVVQLRGVDKTVDAASDMLDAAQHLEVHVRGNALLLINNWYWVLRKTDADGAHLPEKCMFTLGGVRSSLSDHLLGQSVHSVEQAIASAQGGADYLVAGTIFPSQSHPDGQAQGLDYLREICASVSIPVIAIGGIMPARVQECLTAGAAGVAVLSPIMRATDPEAAARAYWNALQPPEKITPCT